MLQGLLPLPGQGVDTDAAPVHHEPTISLGEAKAPLPYLRSRNALKILLDLDSTFGIPKFPKGQSWVGLSFGRNGK